MNAKQQHSWELYERMIARLIADQTPANLCVTPNAQIIGRISKIPRQIDVLIESRHDTDNSVRIIVDAKKRNRKIDITHVESLLGVMADVGASHGYLVCPSGYTEAAEMRAQKNVKIRLVPLHHLDDFDPSTWPMCKQKGCSGRIFWNYSPSFSKRLAHPEETSVESTQIIFHVGKCDKCGYFHVHCKTCDDLFVVPHDTDDHGHTCSCRLPCFWLASIEEDDQGWRSAELHFCNTAGVVTFDRRSL